jgi:hypothetical protein|tara:strand:- start:267 stop:443 length:177 start_codon:yes stop_codon:yes gene_type:complete
MHVLKELGLSGRWITAEKDVNLTSEPSSSELNKLLATSSKKLTKDTFFNVMALPNTWG